MKTLQIVLMGLEWDRIIQPIKKYRPEKVIFVQHGRRKASSDDINEMVRMSKELAEKMIGKIGFLIESETVYTDYHDYEECVQKLLEIFKENKDKYDDIMINVSAGSKIVILASFLVSQFFECKLIYSIPKQYSMFNPKLKVLSKGVSDIKEIETFNFIPLIGLNKTEEKILYKLDNDKISLSSLVVKVYGNLKNEYDVLKKKNLILYHINKMMDKNLIMSENVNGQKYIHLTNLGRFVKDLKEGGHVE